MCTGYAICALGNKYFFTWRVFLAENLNLFIRALLYIRCRKQLIALNNMDTVLSQKHSGERKREYICSSLEILWNSGNDVPHNVCKNLLYMCNNRPFHLLEFSTKNRIQQIESSQRSSEFWSKKTYDCKREALLIPSKWYFSTVILIEREFSFYYRLTAA